MRGRRKSCLVALLPRALAALILLAAAAAQAVEVRFERVNDGVYAFVGETGARTAANEGLNANLGLVVTSAGALLIDRQPTVTLDKLGGRPAWLLRTVGFASQDDANRFCLQLKVAGQRCIAGSTP